MVYVMVTFKNDYIGNIENKRLVKFKKGEVYGVEPLDEKGRVADFCFMIVPKNSQVKIGEIGLNISTSVLMVNLNSYIKHKEAKLRMLEEN